VRRAVLLLALCACDGVFGIRYIDKPDPDAPPPDVLRPGDIGPDGMALYASAVLADGPVAYFRLGETTGTLAANEIATQPPGKYLGTFSLGAPGAIASDPDGALSLDYADPGRVDVGDVYDFPGNAPFSIEAWIDPAPDDGHFHSIVTKWQQPPTNFGYEMFYLDGTLSFSRETTTGGDVVNASGLVAGSYTHVVGTYDGAELQLYVNGMPAGPPKSSTLELPEDNIPFQIGAGNSQAPFGGTIDEVAVYNRALPATRVMAHFMAAH
jgi:hypothetical protein